MIINGYKLTQTCSACPEQYDVTLGGAQVGYLRLRHGAFRADCPDCGGEQVYSALPNGDGCFREEERERYLTEAVAAIDKWVLAQRIEARSDETPQEIRPEGREPDGEAGAPK